MGGRFGFFSLAVVAIWQWTIAKEQARVAFSRQLAAQAVSYLDRKLDLALLLSVESLRVSDTAEARSSLLSAVNHSTRLKTFLSGHNSSVNTLAYISDRKILASGDSRGQDHSLGYVRYGLGKGSRDTSRLQGSR